MKISKSMKQFSLHALPVAVLWAGVSFDANALPAYTRQTGEECAACHVGAYGPQLTPHGMKFKIGGYTDTDGKSGHVPLSAMLVVNYTNVKKDLPEFPEHARENNNFVAQEASVFLAGKLVDHVGSFTQVTYSGIEHKASMDNMDIRATYDFGGTIAGISLNNNPGVTDPLNTLPAWRFPYTSAELGGAGPAAAPILDGGLSGTVYGTNLYLYTQDGMYGEVGFYRSFSEGQLDSMNVEPSRKITNFANHFHVAYIKDLHAQAYSIGLVGMGAKLHDWGMPSGLTDDYTDLGLDANYQFLGNRMNICTLDVTYIKEKQTLNAAFDNGDASKQNATLKQFATTASYYYAQTYGISARYFNLTGSADQARYSPVDQNGDPIGNGKPDSTGYMLQADLTPYGKENSLHSPWANVRLGVQYTTYSKINGASKNYDGAGRDAKDEDTLSFFVWSAI